MLRHLFFSSQYNIFTPCSLRLAVSSLPVRVGVSERDLLLNKKGKRVILHQPRRVAKARNRVSQSQINDLNFLLFFFLPNNHSEMPRYKDEPSAVRVYTVCDESRYLTVKNVPALGCGDDLLQLFSSYGDVEECKPMDAEDCEPFTDVYWIKFHLFSNARFAKRKLDESVFLGNRLQVSYAPHFESLSDTRDKLEGRRREVLARLNTTRPKEITTSSSRPLIKSESVAIASKTSCLSGNLGPNERDVEFEGRSNSGNVPMRMVSSNEDYFASNSMNQTVKIVRDKLDKIRSSGEHLQAGSASKKTRVDNRRRI